MVSASLRLRTSLFSSPTMSTPPESDLFSGLSVEELIAEEEKQDTELPVTSTLGKRTSTSQNDEDDNDDSDEESPGPGGESSQGRSSSVAHQDPGTLRMDQAVRRTA